MRLARSLFAVPLVVALATPAGAICTANVGASAMTCAVRRPRHVRSRMTRDAYGVPHLKAHTLYDVGYGIGLAQAQDRLFQMEFVRKSATGNLAEVVGRDFLADDEDTRRQFYSEEERQYLFTTLSCDLQTIVLGFVDGVNAWMDQIYADTSLANVPHEFFLLPTLIRVQGNLKIPKNVRYTVVKIGGREVYKPDAWRVTDVSAIAALLAGRFGSGGGRQLTQAALLNYLTSFFTNVGPSPGKTAADAARDVFEDVRWLNDPKAPTTVPTTGAINRVIGGTTPVPLAEAVPARIEPPVLLAERLRLLFSPAIALARPVDPRERQHAFVRGLSPETILHGVRAAERLEREAARAEPPLRRLHPFGQQLVGGLAVPQRDRACAPLGRAAGRLRQPEHRLGDVHPLEAHEGGRHDDRRRPGHPDRPDRPVRLHDDVRRDRQLDALRRDAPVAGRPRAADRHRAVPVPAERQLPPDGSTDGDVPLRRRGFDEAAGVRARRARAERPATPLERLPCERL